MANRRRSTSTSPKHLLDYLATLAEEIGPKIRTSKGYEINPISSGYSKIDTRWIPSPLNAYLSGDASELKVDPAIKRPKIYPFRFNLSQKNAVNNALSESLSIVEGPPGTGKTQTILNIIANIVLNGQTVAVVSSNNSAIENVYEKLIQAGFGFVVARLGNHESKQLFIDSHQRVPDMSEWVLSKKNLSIQNRRLAHLDSILDEQLNLQRTLSKLQHELLEVQTEQRHFEVIAENDSVQSILAIRCNLKNSVEALQLWHRLEMLDEAARMNGVVERTIRFFKSLFPSHRRVMRLLKQHERHKIIAACQSEFYRLKSLEIKMQVQRIEESLKTHKFDQKTEEHTKISLSIFKSYLSVRFDRDQRPKFTLSQLKSESKEFIRNYPVVLSTTFSIKNSLSNNFKYDYIIVDEASQVDICTGALALSCAHKAVIVGDLMQLSHVVSTAIADTTDQIFDGFALPKHFRYRTHNLLSSIKTALPNLSHTLLREHYRCHPKIIEFCNTKFYDGKLIPLKSGTTKREPLVVYKTVEGNHARNRRNQRQIDVIRNEVFPEQNLDPNDGTVAIITPYRNQTDALSNAFATSGTQIDTVNKFQGRECPVVILSTVDNEITEFTDNSNRLNVAISRATEQLIVVINGNESETLEDRNIGDLIRYIERNNFTIKHSKVASIFDYLYQHYAEQRKKLLSKRRRISRYDSENLAHALILEILKSRPKSGLEVATHVPLNLLIRDFTDLSDDEKSFVMRSNSHVDFIIFDSFGKAPRLAIEVDGVTYHRTGSPQSNRDTMKNRILEKYSIPLLRLRTDGSQEKEQILSMLDAA